MTKKNKGNGFCPEHFPVGTVFELSQETLSRSMFHGDGPVRIVTGIVRNGVRSYALTTGIVREHTGEEGFNIDHVARIIKRGDGPVLIDNSRYGTVFNEHHAEMIERSRITKPNEELGLRPRKGYYVTADFRTILHYEVSRVVPESATVDYELLSGAVFKQAWYCDGKAEYFWRGATICKKRLRRFVRQNVNRFMVNLHAAEKAYYREMDKLYERDMENELRN